MSVTDRILTALNTVIRMNDKVEAMAGLMKEQHAAWPCIDRQGLPVGCWKRMAAQPTSDGLATWLAANAAPVSEA
jgi:hypothetical protein